MNYVNFTSQCGLLNREKRGKLLKLQEGYYFLNQAVSLPMGFVLEIFLESNGSGYLIIQFYNTPLWQK